MSDPTVLRELAGACANHLPHTPRSFREDSAAFRTELSRLVTGVSQLDPQFGFDLEGRPGAIEAIRRALPVMEAELLDAVLDDVACELAAWQEALYRVATAARG